MGGVYRTNGEERLIRDTDVRGVEGERKQTERRRLRCEVSERIDQLGLVDYWRRRGKDRGGRYFWWRQRNIRKSTVPRIRGSGTKPTSSLIFWNRNEKLVKLTNK